MPLRIAIGCSTRSELTRLSNGDWIHLEAVPPVRSHDRVETPAGLPPWDVLVVETVMEGAAADALVAAVRSVAGDAHLLPPDAVAAGARLAAERFAAGHPVFYDVLPQIRTVVFTEGEPRSRDLIEDEVVPAGKLYRTREPVRFAWPAGKDEVTLYLDKDDDGVPRRRTLAVPRAPNRDEPVEMVLEQAPAAGEAQFVVSSRSWDALRDHPQSLRWTQTEPDGRDWDAIIESLRRPPPPIPDRMVLPNGSGPWIGVRGTNLFGADGTLNGLLADRRTPWKRVADKLAAKAPDVIDGVAVFGVDSDGNLPREADAKVFESAVARARSEIEGRVAGRLPNGDNDPLRFLTWTFRRCPVEVRGEIMRALEDPLHPFHRQGAKQLLHQGFGRTASERAELEWGVRFLRGYPDDSAAWKNYHFALAAFLLSRHDETFDLLRRDDVDRLGRAVARSLRAMVGSTYTSKAIYTPVLLGGLLRWRRREPFALLRGEDAMADAMGAELDRVVDDLTRRAVKLRKTALLAQFQDLQRYLTGEGGRPDILADLVMSA